MHFAIPLQEDTPWRVAALFYNIYTLTSLFFSMAVRLSLLQGRPEKYTDYGESEAFK